MKDHRIVHRYLLVVLVMCMNLKEVQFKVELKAVLMKQYLPGSVVGLLGCPKGMVIGSL